MGFDAALPDELVSLLIWLALTYLRVQSAVLIFPVFSERMLSIRLKITVAMMLTPLALALSQPELRGADLSSPDQFALQAGREMLVGLLIAIPARLMALSLHVATSTIGATASLSQLIGTATEAAPHPIGNLLHIAGLALLMAMGLPLLLVDLILQSYLAFPPGQIGFGDPDMGGIVGLVTRSVVLAFAIASPFILGGLLYQLLTGVVNRVMPSLPVVFIGAPAIILLALAALAVLSPTILSVWAQAVFDVGLFR